MPRRPILSPEEFELRRKQGKLTKRASDLLRNAPKLGLEPKKRKKKPVKGGSRRLLQSEVSFDAAQQPELYVLRFSKNSTAVMAPAQMGDGQCWGRTEICRCSSWGHVEWANRIADALNAREETEDIADGRPGG